MNTLSQIKSDIEDGTLTNPRVVYDRILEVLDAYKLGGTPIGELAGNWVITGNVFYNVTDEIPAKRKTLLSKLTDWYGYLMLTDNPSERGER